MKVICDSRHACAHSGCCGGAQAHDSRDCEPCPANKNARCISVDSPELKVELVDSAHTVCGLRPAKHGWIPGVYECICIRCNKHYTGDKRSFVCEKCAYDTMFKKVLLPLTTKQVEAVTKLYHPNLDSASDSERLFMFQACRDWVECILTNAVKEEKSTPT